ncbi:MAG TPA: protein kinase [Polyangiaceae bacterium]|nr:protein kinase [Polyangiaceae bacterium]
MALFAAATPREIAILRVAEGGMGYVELVARREGRFSRLFARKRLHPHLRAQPAFRAMFLDEARLAGLIRHPNATSVVEIGEDDGGPFLLMDYVDGVNVAQVISHLEPLDRPLPLAFCVSIAAQAARGLHAAHELAGPDGTPLGVVHRDISPKNLLLGYDGWLRVTDFGIAKAKGNVEQTMVGVLKGNIGYMAPEYLAFRDVDQRSDLFALGVVLYELLTRERLYGGDDTSAIARRILEEPPPDVFETRDVPPELSALTFDLLAKDRDLRPPNALAVATQLDEIGASLAAVDGPFDMPAFLEGELGSLRSERKAQVEAALAASSSNDDTDRTRAAHRLRNLWARATLRRAIAIVAALATTSAALWAIQRLSAVPFTPGAAALWSGGEHTCALHAARLECWGNNGRGQLGDGTRDNSGVPVRVDIGPVQAVALGEYHSCALHDDGHVACWGRNARGEIGRATPPFSPQPLDVPGIERATSLAVGRQHTCAVLDGGAVHCWGANFSAQLGRPPSEQGEPPAEVLGLPPARDVFAGGANTCARLRDGTLRCWGANESGQLVSADRTPSSAPVTITLPAGEELIQLSLSNNDRAGSQNPDRARLASFMCAAVRSGAVYCWGNNYTAQLGDGTRDNRAAPTRVIGIDDAIQVAAGDLHACALHRTGAVSCWGRNEFGAVGDGSMGPTLVRTQPVIPGGIERAVGLALGRAHSCARLRDGAISCWGVNNFGQLGDGSTLLRAAPVATNGFP